MSVIAKGPRTYREERSQPWVSRALRGVVARAAIRTAGIDIRSGAVVLGYLGGGLFGSVAVRAWAFGNGPIALWTGVPALVCLVVATALADIDEIELDESGKGVIAGMSQDEFELLVDQVERSAAAERAAAAEPASSDGAPDPFDQLVADALDELPGFLLATLNTDVPVIVTDDGEEHHTYGRFHGGSVENGWRRTIVICRDTLVRDFGHDPGELRRQVSRVVRHEVAHAFGASEGAVRALGL